MKIQLINDWQLRQEPLWTDKNQAARVSQENQDWMDCSLPCDIHTPLIENGIISEPLIGDNFFESHWIEKKSWWFKKIFTADDKLLDNSIIRLVIESIDVKGDVFINGVYLGHQESAFYPFICDVGKYIKKGSNIILVRVTTGLEYVSDDDLSGIYKGIATEEGRGSDQTRGDRRRSFLRKPQYVFGWDWGPRVASCGIMKGAYIEAINRVNIKSIHAVTENLSSDAQMEFEIEIENTHPYATLDADIEIDIIKDDKTILKIHSEEFLCSGINFIKFSADIPSPSLWWPNGMGEPSLYTIKASAKTDSDKCIHSEKFGIRTIKLIQDKIDDKQREFVIEINGIKTFCKGGNWIPADSIYARVSDEKYDTLISEAKNANCNMLRIWGGGLYERDIFYQKCDEYGIMIWHDFMFACALYPDNLEWFKNESIKEIDYQTKRLRNHPSIVIWSGSNENNWGFHDWWQELEVDNSHAGSYIYNVIAPQTVRNNCPEIPYWNGSPYGGDVPNSYDAGDAHIWHDTFMNDNISNRINPNVYDDIDSKFVSEYGYVGPLKLSSIKDYFGDVEIDREGIIWDYHNNFFEKGTVSAGVTKHYADADKLSLDDYLLYAGLTQGMMYAYSLETFRAKPYCAGGIIWMYNDCWGETGWTIIDYYLRRKVSYYLVKRALSPIKMIIREMECKASVTGINETDNDIVFDAEFGYASFDGSEKSISKKRVLLPARTTKQIIEIDISKSNLSDGFVYIKPIDCDDIDKAIFKYDDYRKLNIPNAAPIIKDIKYDGDTAIVTVTSDTFAHAVHLGLDDNINLSDDYFDLLPNECRIVYVYGIDKNTFEESINLRCVNM